MNGRIQIVVFLIAIVPALATAARAAEDRLVEARRLRLTGRYAEAVELYDTLAEKYPLESAVGLARCHRETGRTKDAASVLKAAIENHQDGAALQAEFARLALERGDYDAARKHVDAAKEADNEQLLARWIDAELLRVNGRLDEAKNAYVWFVRYYNRKQRQIKDPESFRWIGLAAAQYARWVRNGAQFSFLVNRLLPKSLEVDEQYWPASLESGLLFLEKYNKRDAKDEFTSALKINPNAARVHAALGQLALQDFELDAAKAAIDRALAINPRLVEAHQLRADLLMANFHLKRAAKALEETRKLNPADEQTLGRLAAVYGAIDGLRKDPADTRMGGVIDDAVKRNEHCGQFYFALAATLELLRKFPHAAVYYDEAQRRMPQLLGPRGRLGLMYMRLGEEVKAAKLLKESFDFDPFNLRVKNTLAVLDVLQNYAVAETEHFVIKFDRGQDDLLVQYATRYLEDEVYPEICEKLGYEPQGKTLLEIFSRSGRTRGHSWFSARMVGMPYIGTVGACAGKMVALASPNERNYNWARVLKHEFVHVVNLQQTDFNIPHWFTEGLAVWHEELPRPSSWNRILASRAAGKKLFNLDTINLGFARPKSGEDWTLAYCQAELYAQYMVETHGADAQAKMLQAYADNLPTSEAIVRCFGVSQAEFEDGYDKFVGQIVSDYTVHAPKKSLSFADLERAAKANPRDADLQARLAYSFLQRRANADARKHALAAQEIDPKHQLAAYVLARLQLLIGDAEQALRLLENAVDQTKPQSNALALLAGLKLKAEQYEAAEKLYELGAKSFPRDDNWRKSQAALYFKSGNNEKLADVLRRIVAVDYDNAVIRKKLAELASDREDFAAAAKWANQVIHINVMDAEVHAMLGRASAGQKKHEDAIREYETAFRLDGGRPDWQLALAESYLAAKQHDKARGILDELLEQDADNEQAKKLRESLPK